MSVVAEQMTEVGMRKSRVKMRLTTGKEGEAEHLREHAMQPPRAQLNHPTLETSVAPGFTCLLCQNTGQEKTRISFLTFFFFFLPLRVRSEEKYDRITSRKSQAYKLYPYSPELNRNDILVCDIKPYNTIQTN